MSESSPAPTTRGYSPARDSSSGPGATSLADILERVLDKGIIIAGDIQVNLLDIELLTIRIRLLVVSVDKAEQMGIDWWRHDAGLTSTKRELETENRELRERIEQLESESTPRQSRAQKRS
jgi:Gas vesicle protein